MVLALIAGYEEKPPAGHHSQMSYRACSDVGRLCDLFGISMEVKGQYLLLAKIPALGNFMREQRCLAQEVF